MNSRKSVPKGIVPLVYERQRVPKGIVPLVNSGRSPSVPKGIVPLVYGACTVYATPCAAPRRGASVGIVPRVYGHPPVYATKPKQARVAQVGPRGGIGLQGTRFFWLPLGLQLGVR